MKKKSLMFDFQKDIDATSYISLLGLDPEPLTQAPVIRAAVRTDVQTGGLHGLSYLAKKNRKGGHSLKINHWVLYPDGTKHTEKVVRLKSAVDDKGRYSLSDANLFGKKIKYQNERHFFQFLSQLKDILLEIRRHHLPSLKTILDLQKSFIPDTDQYRQGMDGTGEPLFFESTKVALKKPPIFSVPSHILPALLGFHSDIPTEQKPVITKMASGNEIETHRPVFAKTEIKKTDGNGLRITVQSWKQNSSENKMNDNEKPAIWFDLKFVPDPENMDSMKLSQARCCGKLLKLNNHKDIVRLCRATAAAVHQIRTKEMIPSLQKLLQDNGMHEVVNRPPTTHKKMIAENGRMTFNVLGGNNTQNIKFNEARIGANGYLYTYQRPDQKKPDGILVDAGVLFLNREQHGHDGAFINPEGILSHRESGHVEPTVSIKALLCTHSHEDHVGAIPHLVKAGYIVPKIICSAITKAFIEEKLKALDISKDEWPEFKNMEAYQRCQVGPFRLRALPMSHSAPSLAFRIATKAGSVLHLGDWKMDPTVKVGYGTDASALKRLRVDAVVSDSTSVFREGKAVEESTIERNFIKLFNDYSEHRPIVSQLGSNLNRLVTILRAGAQAGKTPIIVGHSLDVSRRILNKVGFLDPLKKEYTTLKNYIQNAFNITLLTGTSKKGKNLLRAGSIDTLIIATGTHNEELSATDKMLDWIHKDVELWPDQDMIIRSQRAIPGSEREYNLMKTRAQDQGIKIIDPTSPEAKGLDIYGSGHGHKGDLAAMINLSSSKYFIPVHGDASQLQAHADLIKEHNKIAIVTNNQNIIEIKRGQKPEIIGNRIESWAYYEHQRPSNQYYGGAVRYDIGLANPLLLGKWASSGNLPSSLINYTQPQETNYQPQPAKNHQISYPNPAPVKGKLLNIWHKKYSKITFYDCETTSLHNGEITQFAAVTENHQNELTELNIRQKIQNHVLPSPIACLVTNISPYFLRDKSGMNSEEFSKTLQQHFYTLPEPGQKALAVGHNNLKADDEWIRKTLFKNGFANSSVTNTHRMRRADTLQMSRAVYLYSPDALKVPIEKERPSFRLGNLVTANGLVSNTDDAHDALFDVKITRKLFYTLLEKSPNISKEMLDRVDFQSNQNWLLGVGKGVQYRPLVTYAINGPQGPEALMGMLSNIDLKESHGRKAIMINLNEDPNFFNGMDPDDICSLLMTNDQQKIHILPLHKQPIILPAHYGYAVNANQNIDHRILQERQQNVLRNPERQQAIAKGVSLYLKKKQRNTDPFYLEDSVYNQPKTHYERQALIADKALLKAIDPTHDVSPKEIANALEYAQHPDTRHILKSRLISMDPTLLPESSRKQIESENRLALYAPANSPKMTLKQFKKEMREISESADHWIGNDSEKQTIYDDLINFGKEFEIDFVRNKKDEINAGVALHARLSSRNRLIA